MTAPALEDGPVYPPETISEAGWLGQLSPSAIRKACQQGALEHTRIRGKIGMTRANILANQAAGHEPAKADREAAPRSPGRPRRPFSIVPTGEQFLKADPSRRRRSRQQPA